MGARATNARWFRSPPEPAEPYDYFAPRIHEPDERQRLRNRIFLALAKSDTEKYGRVLWPHERSET
jgi:hypothetical protein